MGKRIYSLKPISYWRAYELDEICIMLKVHIQTVRKWITKCGLKTIDNGKPSLVYGNDLREFLGEQNVANEFPSLAFEEFNCLSCKEPKKPFKKRIAIVQQGKSVMVKTLCQTCKTKMQKPYKLDDIPRLRECFRTGDVLELYDSDDSPSNTHLGAQDNKQANEPKQKELFE